MTKRRRGPGDRRKAISFEKRRDRKGQKSRIRRMRFWGARKDGKSVIKTKPEKGRARGKRGQNRTCGRAVMPFAN